MKKFLASLILGLLLVTSLQAKEVLISFHNMTHLLERLLLSYQRLASVNEGNGLHTKFCDSQN